MDSSEQPKQNGIGPSDANNKTLIRVGGVIALAVVAGFIAWFVIDRSGDDSTTPTTTTTSSTIPVGPVAVTAEGLSGLVADVGHLVYWAGPQTGKRYEFLKTSTGQVYIRYLPAGVEAGDSSSDYLTIATYPFPNGYEALQNVAKDNAVEIPGGGIAGVTEGRPTSVHFAFPEDPFQGEIYDPSPARALRVATSGKLQTVP